MLIMRNKLKVQSDAEISIAIMSGNFVMRGEPAIYNKFLRTQMALSNVDLVVELPLSLVFLQVIILHK